MKNKYIGFIDEDGRIIEGVTVPECIADLPRYDFAAKLEGQKRVIQELETSYGKYIKVTDLIPALEKLKYG